MIYSLILASENEDTANKEFQIALSESDDNKKLEIYDRIIRYAPDYMPALYNRALLLMKKKLWEEAKVDLKFYINKNNNDFNAINNLAYIEYKSGNKNEAIDLWGQALKLKPDDRKLIKNLAMALFETGRKKESLYFIDRALSFKNNELTFLKMKSVILKDNSDRLREESFLEYFLSKYPQEFNSLHRYTKLLSDSDRRDEAFDFAKKIIIKNNLDKKYFFLLAPLSLGQNDNEFCITYLKNILLKNSISFKEEEIDYIADYLRLNINNEAVSKIIPLLLENYADNSQLMMLKALSLFNNGEFQKSKSLSLDILAEDNNNKQALDIYFNSFIKMGDEDEFLTVMQERREREEVITYNAAVTELKIMIDRKMLPGAHKICENYLKLFPQNAEFQMAAGNILLNNNMLDEAILYLEKAYALEHSFYEAGVLYAKALYRKGFSDDALNIMKDLYEAFSIEKDVVLTYVFLLNETGNDKLARSIYKKFAELEKLPDYDYFFSDFQNRGI